ncbi:MAG TPA: hypothetical protein VFA27_08925 [Vicinamibacterales bacterium]|nr:hypothetical protein [Vicinamibacterales bacterium]
MIRSVGRFGLIALTFAAVACVLPSTRRAHDENMAKAEAFKKVFDRDVRPGASFEEVLTYLTVHNLHFGPVGLESPNDVPPPIEGTGDLEVQMFREKSPHWYCGNGSVGLGTCRS